MDNLVYINKKANTLTIDGTLSEIIQYYGKFEITRKPKIYQVNSIIADKPRGCEIEIWGEPSDSDVLVHRYEKSAIIYDKHRMRFISDRLNIIIRGINLYHPDYRMLI